MATEVKRSGVELFEEMQQRVNDPTFKRFWPNGMPVVCDDEGEVGESTIHTLAADILFYGLSFHFAGRPNWRVFKNLNLYYRDDKPNVFVAPDGMVIESARPLPKEMNSYRLGKDGPGPRLVAEVLSPRNYDVNDMGRKALVYHMLGVEEYILVDASGDLLPEKLLLMRPIAGGKWIHERDADGGITSRFGFRVIIDTDGQLRVLDAQTGKLYPRPSEAEQLAAEAEAGRLAEARLRALEEEVAHLRANGAKPNGSAPHS